MIDVPFDQYQRYKTTEMVVTSLKMYHNLDSLKIIEVGANEHKNLEKFLEKDEIYYLDIQIPKHLKDDPRYILGDATNLVNIKDNEYDMVVALDVYEHIPKDKREDFLKELDRISKYGAMVCAPFNFEYVESAEIRANEYFNQLTGEDYIWLKEHIEEGLPCLQNTKDILKKLGKQFMSFGHGDIYLWERLIKCHFYVCRFNETLEYRKLIDKLYNSEIFNSDISERNYREFILYSNDKLSLESIDRNIKDMFNKHENTKNIDLLSSLIKDIESITNVKMLNRIEIKNKGEQALKELTYYIRSKDEELYSENKTIKIKIKSQKIIDKIDLSNYNIGTEIRIDPINCNCIIDILDIYTIKDNKRIDLEITRTNCDISYGNRYFYSTNDPQIYVDLKSIDIDNIYFSCILIDSDNKYIEDMIDTIHKINLDKDKNINELTSKLETKDASIKEFEKEIHYRELIVDELKTRIKVLENYVHKIESSRSWKILKKVKSILKR